MDKQADVQELALAIHLSYCQRRLKIRHSDLCKLTDVCTRFSQLMHLQKVEMFDLFKADHDKKADNWNLTEQTIENQVQEFYEELHQADSQKKALQLAYNCQPLAIQAILSSDSDYPKNLKEIHTYPALLYIRGTHLAAMNQQNLWVTVIGTRRPTYYGQMVTQQITKDLCQQGVVIVSGLARGIDTKAHQTALAYNGRTIGVIGCGHDFNYPPENDKLIAQMAETGVVLSEHPPGVPPIRQNFPARNRLLSGLSEAVAVMEAAQKSGTLITTDYAAEQNRDVFAVPGSILDPASAGCHQLIRDGASLLMSAEDILNTYDRPRQISFLPTETRPKSGFAALADPELQAVLQVLRGHRLTMDALVLALEKSTQETISRVALLEMEGYLSLNRGRYALTALGQSSI